MTGGVGGLQGSLAEYAVVGWRSAAPKNPPISPCVKPRLSADLHHGVEGLGRSRCGASGKKVLIHGGAAASVSRHPDRPRRRRRGIRDRSAASKTFIERLGAVAIDYREMSVEN